MFLKSKNRNHSNRFSVLILQKGPKEKCRRRCRRALWAELQGRAVAGLCHSSPPEGATRRLGLGRAQGPLRRSSPQQSLAASRVLGSHCPCQRPGATWGLGGPGPDTRQGLAVEHCRLGWGPHPQPPGSCASPLLWPIPSAAVGAEEPWSSVSLMSGSDLIVWRAW